MSRTELISPGELQPVQERANRILDELDRILLGHHEVHRLLLIGILSRGHILLEGLPGVGKTALVKALGTLLVARFQADSVHAGSAAERHPRLQHPADDAGRGAEDGLSARRDLFEHPACGRDQPRFAEDAVRHARGDAGTCRDAARRDAPPAGTVFRARLAESDRA